jgi:hypothetical protein
MDKAEREKFDLWFSDYFAQHCDESDERQYILQLCRDGWRAALRAQLPASPPSVSVDEELLAALRQAIWHLGEDSDRAAVLAAGDGWLTDRVLCIIQMRKAIQRAEASKAREAGYVADEEFWHGVVESLGTSIRIDFLGQALELEQSAKKSESRSARRAMESAAHTLRVVDDVAHMLRVVDDVAKRAEASKALQDLADESQRMGLYDQPSGELGKSAEQEKVCEWVKSDVSGTWTSTCGRLLCSMQYGHLCQYCGRPLRAIDAALSKKAGE